MKKYGERKTVTPSSTSRFHAHTTTALIKFTTLLCCIALALQDGDGNYTPIPLKMASLSPHNF